MTGRRYNICSGNSDLNTKQVASYIADKEGIPYTRITRDPCFNGHDVWNKKDAQFSVHKGGDEIEVISQKVEIPIKPIINLREAIQKGNI